MRYSIFWDYTSAKLNKNVSVMDFISAIEGKIFHDEFLMERQDFCIFSDPFGVSEIDESFKRELKEGQFEIIQSAMFEIDEVVHHFLVDYEQKQSTVQLIVFSNYLDHLPLVYDFLTKNSHKFHVIHSSKNINSVKLDCKLYQLDDILPKNDLNSMLDDNLGEGANTSNFCGPKNIDSTHKGFNEMYPTNTTYLCQIRFCSGKEKEVSACLKTKLSAFKMNVEYLQNGDGMLEFFSGEDSMNACEILENCDPSLEIRATPIDTSDVRWMHFSGKCNNGTENSPSLEALVLNVSTDDIQYNSPMTSDASAHHEKNRGFFVFLYFKKTNTEAFYLSRIRDRLKEIQASPMYIDPGYGWGVLGFSSGDDRETALIRLELGTTVDGIAFNPEPVDMLPSHFIRHATSFNPNQNSTSCSVQRNFLSSRGNVENQPDSFTLPESCYHYTVQPPNTGHYRKRFRYTKLPLICCCIFILKVLFVIFRLWLRLVVRDSHKKDYSKPAIYAPTLSEGNDYEWKSE